jgi:hypothetical protein
MTSVLPYSSLNNGQFVESAFIKAARELKNKFVLVAPDKFLAKYLPQLPSHTPEMVQRKVQGLPDNLTMEKSACGE